ILDAEGRITTILVGTPDDSSWSSVIGRCEEVMTGVRDHSLKADVFSKDHQQHRRGHFVAIPLGVSHGGGREEPGNFYHPPKRAEILKPLLDDPAVGRLAGFQSSALSYYAPKLYANLCRHMVALHQKKQQLRKNFRNSIFSGATFNLGPKTESFEHTDANNVAYGLCALTSLGAFDPDKGGHLILYDLKLFVRFPRGATILLLSSVLRHGNTPIASNETRMSLSQYCAGGIFQWLRYGCKTAVQLTASTKGRRFKKSVDKTHEERVMESLSLFSTLDSLEADRNIIISNWKKVRHFPPCVSQVYISGCRT
ncbi:hypothetical protein BDN72DRAFT_779789, partial [Pluteus cervinus]